MLKIGDTVKVIGKTLDGSGEEKELIPIGTICCVVGYYNDDKNGLTIGIRPVDYYPEIGVVMECHASFH